MKKTTKAIALSILFGVAALTPALAEKSPVYISPDHNGVQDALVVPLQIKDKRFIKMWSFTIYDEQGNEVCVIGNKEKRPESFSFKSFFKALLTPKTGVDIPSEVMWNGTADDKGAEAGYTKGAVVPDGTYYYQFSASDDNDNEAKTSKMVVIVDSTPPEINLKQIAEGDKTFGEGAKSTLKIVQNGSEEDLWYASVNNAYGSAVKTFRFEHSEPLEIVWDGTDDQGGIVSDGVYSYSITSTDRAGNTSENAIISNIIYSGEKPKVNLTIAGSKYFSPKAKKVENQKLKLNVQIDKPSSSVNSLVAWTVDIRDTKGNTVYTYKGDSNPPSVIEFDGSCENGEAIADGQYTARVTAEYLNGYKPVVDSPSFVLDTTVPEPALNVKDKYFNGSSNLVINQKYLDIDKDAEYKGKKEWVGHIVKADDSTSVRTFEFGESIPDTVLWNGLDDAGNFCADGNYVYVLTSTKPSGITSETKTASFTLNTEDTELRVAVSPTAFSPYSGKQNVIFTPYVKAATGLKSYTFTVMDAKGVPVYRVSQSNESGVALPATFKWDGLTKLEDSEGARCEDGSYTARLDTVEKSGTSGSAVTQAFILDSVAPSVDISADYAVFSPDGISSRQILPVKVTNCSTETKWTATISRDSKTVRTFTWQDGKAQNFNWDGTDESGNKAPNGTYTITVSSTDAAGNTGSSMIQNIVLDAREVKAYVTAESDGFSPNGDGFKDAQVLNIRTTLNEGIETWSLAIIDEKGNSVRSWNQNDSKDLPSQFTWAGDAVDAKGKSYVANGKYYAKLNIKYTKGNEVSSDSSTFICTADAPSIKVQTAPLYFSPDDDGIDDDLFVKLSCSTLANVKLWSFTIFDRNGNPFWKTSGKNSITDRIIWDGYGTNGELVQSAEDYPYEFSVTDDLGMTSTVTGVISTDVLVVRDGDYLKMQVPAIIFRPNAADFNLTEYNKNGSVKSTGITKEQLENNNRVLKRVAEILKKFGNYDVLIVGHANSISGSPKEDTEKGWWGDPAQPLSKERAEFVKKQLIKYGIMASRLSTDGKGTAEMVAPYNNKNESWKNRRVEFILIKK